MSIVLENSVKETLAKAALEQSSSMIKGSTGVTPYEAVETAGMVYGVVEGGAEALAVAPAIAAQLTAQIVGNVSVYAAEKLGKVMAEVLMPPTPGEIFGKAGQEVSKFLKSSGDIMKELSSDSEKQNSDDAKKKQEEAIDEKAKKQKEKANAMKKQVQDVVAKVQEQCINLQKYITQGEVWAEKNANEIEAKAKKQIDEVVDTQVAKILDDKKEFIDGMADGIAKRTADVANKALKKLTKEKLDKINTAKQKVTNVAKAKVGKSLLNLMATLGL